VSSWLQRQKKYGQSQQTPFSKTIKVAKGSNTPCKASLEELFADKQLVSCDS
jgi:hypothetical protein